MSLPGGQDFPLTLNPTFSYLKPSFWQGSPSPLNTDTNPCPYRTVTFITGLFYSCSQEMTTTARSHKCARLPPSAVLFTEGSQPSGFTASPVEFHLNLRLYLLSWTLFISSQSSEAPDIKSPDPWSPSHPRPLPAATLAEVRPFHPVLSPLVPASLCHGGAPTHFLTLASLLSGFFLPQDWVIYLKAWPLASRELSLLRLCVIPGI